MNSHRKLVSHTISVMSTLSTALSRRLSSSGSDSSSWSWNYRVMFVSEVWLSSLCTRLFRLISISWMRFRTFYKFSSNSYTLSAAFSIVLVRILVFCLLIFSLEISMRIFKSSASKSSFSASDCSLFLYRWISCFS